ncbi:MAG: hypothetical protein JWO30_3503 [Fibrobacteres bacterium]|nr:hypothetical protein [Fibrobacterota bacterium]
MDSSNDFKAVFMGSGTHKSAFRIFGKSMVTAVCALSLAFLGCSQKASSSKVVAPPGPGENTDPKKVVSKLDSLVKQNAGKGKGVVTGFLTGEGKSVASGLLKQASNAGGERRLLTKTEIPLTGATILIFNSLKATTAADTTLKTDSLGNYTCVLNEGKYFGFAVYLDLETFQLVTTGIPNMNPKADTIIHMDTATAIEDVTAPTVAGVYDANSSNSDGIFLVGSVPDKNAKINITFSEPMNRESANKGVILGRIDTANTSTSMVLADTVKTSTMTMSWSGDSKELTLSIASLSTGAQYGLILPTTLKDLAKNPLEKEYKATFVTAAAAELAAVKFAVVSTVPGDKESIKPIQNPGVSFNRPVETFSLLKGATIVPAVTGYWEVSGARAVFIHKEPLAVGTTYTVSIPVSVTDLSGQALAGASSFSFIVKDFEGAAKDNSGKEKDVALAVESAFDAYLSGDIGRFGAAFHPNFRLYDEDGSIRSKGEFLDKIRADVGESQALAAGIMGPVFDTSAAACKDHMNVWKVGAEGGTADDVIWVSAYVNPGQSPAAFGLDHKQINPSDLIWDPTGPRFTYKGKKYGFGPDMTRFHGPVNMDAAKGDLRFMADLLKQTSTVVLEPVKLESRTEFKVDNAITLNGDTANLAVKMIDYSKYSRTNFRDGNMACTSLAADTNYQILKFVLINDGSKWLVISIVSPAKVSVQDFNKTVDTKDFQIKQILPITLTAPLKNDAQGADGKVVFKFKGPAHDSIGGYLVGIAEDPKFCFGRQPVGALIFVKASNHTGAEESFVLNGSGIPEGNNATSILRRVADLRLPGWDRTMFENSITSLFDATKGFGGVYNWKAIAIKDTSATQFLANGFLPERFYAESDFGPTKGYFACKAFPQGDAAFNALQSAQQTFVNNQPVVGNSFSDMDMDGIPDGIEAKYKTDPRDRNSYPDFRTDTDGDGLADFLEAMLDPKGTLAMVTNKATEAGVKEEIAKLIAAGIPWQDTDGDGFPDDIEMMQGFNPNDAKNNPGTRPRTSAPIGVFAGKFQMGTQTNNITFKLYTDTAKALWVTYTAVIGSDTLTDSVRTMFNEGAGEVYIPVALLKNGPDAGRALLMRGHYDAISSLLMGPIDMITAPAKGSVNFGSGPYVGQFAASGRGEDVSRYLPGNNTGTVVNNPVNNPVNNAVTYRMPPAGVKEGALIILAAGKVTLVDEFGDTLAVIENLSVRPQADGSYEFFGEKKVVAADNSYKRSEVGGRIVYDQQGSWVVDGHFFQESDSSGVHKSIPGQLNAKGLKADMTPSTDGITGTMKGWIAQDKSGNGFTAQPVNNVPACDPTKGPCTTDPNACDPAKGPCNTNPCPAGQVCPPVNNNPGTSFQKSFMAGTVVFKMYLERAAIKSGDYFYVSMGGRVYRVKNDSLHVANAMAPMCGQVVLTLEAIPAKDESSGAKAAFMADSMGLPMGSTNLVFLMEDQFAAGVPNRLDKAFDNQGEVRANVFVVEIRPVTLDYGKSAMVCGNGPIVNNPVCDPTKQVCNQPCDPARGPCGPVDTNKVVCDPAKGPCNQPCDPAKGPCGPAVGGFKAPLYKGPLDMLTVALGSSNNQVGLVKDSTMTVSGKVTINPASITVEPNTRNVIVMDAAGTGKYLVLAIQGDSSKILIKDGMPLVFPKPNDSGTVVNNPPKDTVPPVVNNPPQDTAKPVPYIGTVDNLRSLLVSKLNKVRIPGPNGVTDAVVNPESLQSDGTYTTGVDANNSTRIYVFLAPKAAPTKVFLGPDGAILVAEKSTIAGL